MDARGLSKDNIVAGAERSSMAELASLTESAKKFSFFKISFVQQQKKLRWVIYRLIVINTVTNGILTATS